MQQLAEKIITDIITTLLLSGQNIEILVCFIRSIEQFLIQPF